MSGSARWVALLLGVAVTLCLAGCGGSSSTAKATAAQREAPGLPARPVELRIDGVDPCSLLAPGQLGPLGVGGGAGTPGEIGSDGPLQGKTCIWSNFPERPDRSVAAELVTNHGAEFALGVEPLRAVAGFAATAVGSVGTDPKYYCRLLVDVAFGQALSVDYSNLPQDDSGLTHEVACERAGQFASAMLTTLKSIKKSG